MLTKRVEALERMVGIKKRIKTTLGYTDFVNELLDYASHVFDLPLAYLQTTKGNPTKKEASNRRRDIVRVQYCIMTILIEQGFSTTSASVAVGGHEHTRAIEAKRKTYERLELYEEWSNTYNTLKAYVESINRRLTDFDGEGQESIPELAEVD